jgi:hypothetical protein
VLTISSSCSTNLSIYSLYWRIAKLVPPLFTLSSFTILNVL